VLAYAGLVVLLRISGNRTLSKMNSFDLVVTVAFGSTLSTILVNKDVSLAEGLTALALLVVLQLIVTWCSVRSRFISKVVETEPTMLLHDGALLHDAMRQVRVTKGEVRAAVSHPRREGRVNAVHGSRGCGREIIPPRWPAVVSVMPGPR
jgi:uncharacterized membrane protein YcaP (DUF421 family)